LEWTASLSQQVAVGEKKLMSICFSFSLTQLPFNSSPHGGEPHARRGKPRLLSVDHIQSGRDEMPTDGLLSLPKDIMRKPDAVKLCVQK
jgi:hypothetical protein